MTVLFQLGLVGWLTITHPSKGCATGVSPHHFAANDTSRGRSWDFAGAVFTCSHLAEAISTLMNITSQVLSMNHLVLPDDFFFLLFTSEAGNFAAFLCL